MKSKEDTFEQFLQAKHQELHPEILDDDLPDAFDLWLYELVPHNFVEYADRFANERQRKEREEIRDYLMGTKASEHPDIASLIQTLKQDKEE